MNSLLNIIESVLEFLVYLGLLLGALMFLFFGLMDITGTSMIGSNYIIVGVLGLGLASVSIFGVFVLGKKKMIPQILVGTALVGLSIVFSNYSPARMMALFGGGSPDQFAAMWTGGTGILIILLVMSQKATGRSG